MSAGPVRPQVLAQPVWLAVAVLWWVQLLVPWTSDGTLSRSTLLDAVTLVRGGSVDALLPDHVEWAVLAPPVLALLALALSGVRGAVALVVRVVVGVGGAVVVVVLARVLPQDGASLALGGRLALAGLGVVIVAVLLDVAGHVWLRRADRSGERHRPVLRPLGIVVATACLVLAAVGGGGLAAQVVTHRGGADTPEQAARDLVAAIVEQDGVAVLRAVAPDERDEVVAAYVRLRDRFADSGDESDSGGAGGPGGTGPSDVVTFEVGETELEVEPQDDDHARVRLVGGPYTIRVDVEALPGPLAVLAGVFTDGEFSGDLAQAADEGPLAWFTEGQLTLTAERVDGRWYVTGLGTAIDHVTGTLLGDDLATPDLDDLPGVGDLLGELSGRLGD